MLRSALNACLLLSYVLSVAFAGADRWDPVKDSLTAWSALQFDTSFSVHVGDATGELFTWSTPGFSIDNTRMAGASLSKWPASVMISGLVADGTMSYDDLANKHLRWWATDKNDPRSGVRLRHLLSFTSGFTEDALVTCAALNFDFEGCAERLYHKSRNYTAPGKTWTYLSCHLQFAGAMAVAASGRPIHELFDRYLYSPFNMTSTTWSPKRNPSMAAGITTTARDFQNLLSGLLTYRVLPKHILDQMEMDLSKAPIAPSGDGWFGHYGMGHWWECLGYGTPLKFERRALPSVCTAAHVQAGPGMYGFYPLIDRSGGGGHAGPARQPYYFQIALQESFSLSGIPEYLRIALKPVVDVVLSGGDPLSANRTELLYQGGGLLRRDLEDIESALGKCECSGGSNGEPYSSLALGMPKDEPHLLRREIAAHGVGLLLRELVAVQAKLGMCKCHGRKGQDSQ